MAHRCPNCGAVVPESAGADPEGDIQCPECRVWIAAPSSSPRNRWGDEGVRSSGEGRSNAALWIGLAVGGGILLLLIVLGGIGGFVWFLGRTQQARRAEVQAQMQAGNFPGGPNPFQARAAFPPAPQIVPPTEFPPQTEDYAEARKKFKTKLEVPMAAPQQTLPMNLPPEAEELVFQSGDLRLKAWVSRDPADGKGKKPAVLYLHDGFSFGNDDWDQSKPFRDAGFVVLMPILRGENDQEGNFSLFYDEVDDVLAAADALEKLPYIDGKRMYLAGHSQGGTLTLLTALTTPRFRAAASFSGSPDQSNWSAVRSNMNGFVTINADVPYDAENEKESCMRSPLAFAESFKCPVRIYFGDQEAYFKACSEKLAEKAKKKKLDVEAVEVPGPHFDASTKTGAVTNAIQQCIDFFKKH